VSFFGKITKTCKGNLGFITKRPDLEKVVVGHKHLSITYQGGAKKLIAQKRETSNSTKHNKSKGKCQESKKRRVTSFNEKAESSRGRN